MNVATVIKMHRPLARVRRGTVTESVPTSFGMPIPESFLSPHVKCGILQKHLVDDLILIPGEFPTSFLLHSASQVIPRPQNKLRSGGLHGG